MFRRIFGLDKEVYNEPKMELEHVDADHQPSEFETASSVASTKIHQMKDEGKTCLAKSKRFSSKGNGLNLGMLPSQTSVILFRSVHRKTVI
jgi:hypothetical protein